MKGLKSTYKGMFILRTSLTAVWQISYKDFFKINIGIITLALLVLASILITNIISRINI